MDTTLRLSTPGAAKRMLTIVVAMLALQLLVAAFAPAKAEARRWGGGYEVRATYYGYIIYCEEPVNNVFDPVYASREWRTTMFETHGANWREALRRRDDLNYWFEVVAATRPQEQWLGKRCISTMPTQPIVRQRRVWYYTGLDGSEFRSDATWALKSAAGTY